MSVYQVAILFEAENDQQATLVAERFGLSVKEEQDNQFITSAKIAFTRFEKEAEDVASE